MPKSASIRTNKVLLTEIFPNESNPRLISEEKFEKLITSLLIFPRMLEIRPIVVDGGSVILAGNMRHRALMAIAAMDRKETRKRLATNSKFEKLSTEEKEQLLDHWFAFQGDPAVNVIKAGDLSEEEKREFLIKDNVGFGGWDYDMLANEWDVHELLDWGMDVWDTEPPSDDDDEPAEKEKEYRIEIIVDDEEAQIKLGNRLKAEGYLVNVK